MAALAGSVVMAGALTAAGGPAGAATCGGGTTLMVPQVSELHGIAVISACDVWVAGEYSDTPVYLAKTLIEHWDGTAWTQVPSPDPGPFGSYLTSMTAVSPDDIWAAGFYDACSNPRTLVLHWDGTAWTQVPSPNARTGDSSDNELSSIRAVSATDIWAVGSFRNYTDSPAHTLIEHWDGTAWTRVPSPNPGGPSGYDSLNSVAAVSARNVWAVGSMSRDARTLIVHWNGSSWKQVASPNPDSGNVLYGVRVISARDIWAVGGDTNTGTSFGTLIVHWNGSAWKRVPSPSPGSTESTLFGLAPLSRTSIWAAGRYNGVPGGYGILLEHWNGRSWRWVKTPSMVGALYGAGGSAAAGAWAVGESNGHGVALHLG